MGEGTVRIDNEPEAIKVERFTRMLAIMGVDNPMRLQLGPMWWGWLALENEKAVAP